MRSGLLLVLLVWQGCYRSMEVRSRLPPEPVSVAVSELPRDSESAAPGDITVKSSRGALRYRDSRAYRDGDFVLVRKGDEVAGVYRALDVDELVLYVERNEWVTKEERVLDTGATTAAVTIGVVVVLRA